MEAIKVGTKKIKTAKKWNQNKPAVINFQSVCCRLGKNSQGVLRRLVMLWAMAVVIVGIQ